MEVIKSVTSPSPDTQSPAIGKEYISTCAVTITTRQQKEIIKIFSNMLFKIHRVPKTCTVYSTIDSTVSVLYCDAVLS